MGFKFRKPKPEQTAPAPAVAEDHQMDVEEVIEAVSERKVQEPASDRGGATVQNVQDRPDFRGLGEPERTLQRMKYVLKHPDLPPTFRAAAALLVAEFYQNDENCIQKLNISALFPAPEYTQRTRIEMMKVLENLGLIQRDVVKRQGQNVRLMF